MRPVHPLTALLAALLLFGLVACGEADPSADRTATAPETPAEEPTEDDADAIDDPVGTEAPAPPTEPLEDEDDEEGAAPLGDFGTDEVASDDFPSHEGEVALLADVRVGGHGGFQRVVFEFESGDEPSYRVRYTDPPILQSGSGEEVEVAGEAFLELILEPASGVDLSGETYEEVYTGPDRLDAPDGPITEVVRFGDFEANMGWVIGLEEQRPFAVTWLSDPLRLVVEIEA